ncbi:Hypothetical predicted protein [Mytilus galloprovincialis]|uniref:Uncharacterized protein n=1 Tax=Mytilus galloprovincialis TaxID=29158 RepID=A0A8B6DMV4_MYTGA|nr:Hypothetical predicted protein [Mytilus galloprovincialis]
MLSPRQFFPGCSSGLPTSPPCLSAKNTEITQVFRRWLLNEPSFRFFTVTYGLISKELLNMQRRVVVVLTLPDKAAADQDSDSSSSDTAKESDSDNSSSNSSSTGDTVETINVNIEVDNSFDL